MKMNGEELIPATRQRVWEALNDPDVLKACIPGCEEIHKISPTEFEARVVAKVGPVKAGFTGAVKLSDLDPPNSYVITGEGKGGAAGFAKGGAKVRLEEAEGGTRLFYDVDAQVGGKLAQIGSRLIDSTAKKLASEFFNNFAGAAARDEGPAAAVAAALPEEAVPAPAPKKARAPRKTTGKTAAKTTRSRKSASSISASPEPAPVEANGSGASVRERPVVPPIPLSSAPSIKKPAPAIPPQAGGSPWLWWMVIAAAILAAAFLFTS